MAMAVSPEIVNRLEEALALLQPLLNDYDYNAARHYMSEGAYTLTFEHLCEQLYEFSTPISEDIYARLEDLGQMLGYHDESHWKELVPQVE